MHCRRFKVRTAALGWAAVLLLVLPTQSWARTTEACANAAEAAAEAADIPREWMHAIALAESGRGSGKNRTAWPWTVNDEGQGLWFDRKGEAVRHVKGRLAKGRHMVDVGCFQINWHWHGKAFSSVEAAFEPKENARYAAQFLRSLYEETGSWQKAVGRYHSATLALAKPYAERVARMRGAVPSQAVVSKQAAPPASRGAVLISTFPSASPLLWQPRRPLFDRKARKATPISPRLRRVK